MDIARPQASMCPAVSRSPLMGRVASHSVCLLPPAGTKAGVQQTKHMLFTPLLLLLTTSSGIKQAFQQTKAHFVHPPLCGCQCCLQA